MSEDQDFDQVQLQKQIKIAESAIMVESVGLDL